MGLQYPYRVQITSKDIHELGRTLAGSKILHFVGDSF